MNSKLSTDQTVLNVVKRSLIAVGSEREASFYADLFKNLAPERFALIVIDPRCMVKPLFEAFVSDLKILSDLGLTPILLIGALHEEKFNVRVQSGRLCKELDGAKIKSTRLNCASYQLISEVRAKANAGQIVVLEKTDNRQGVDLVELTEKLKPAKIIFLQPSGGFRKNGNRVPVLNVDKPASFPPINQLSEGQVRFIEIVKGLVETATHKCTYVIVSPLNFLSELFTVRGAGTMLRRGAKIQNHENHETLDVTALKASIQSAFGRKLHDSFFDKKTERIILEEKLRGGAIITKLSGLPYLNKFWVTQEAQGEGIARDIWYELCAQTPAFFWRSRKNNPFNTWYMNVCEGMQVSGDWRVFWIGLQPKQIQGAVQAATQAPEDFN